MGKKNTVGFLSGEPVRCELAVSLQSEVIPSPLYFDGFMGQQEKN